MKKSEFQKLYPALVNRAKQEALAELEKSFAQVLSGKESPEERMAEMSGIALSVSFHASSQLIYDALLNMGLLEED